MTAAPEGTLTATARLRAALEGTAAALARADIERLLASDTELQGALNALSSQSQTAPADREAMRRDLDGAAVALRRCRRLGAGLGDFVRFTIEAQGNQCGYEPARAAAAALAGRSFSGRA